MGAVAIAEDRTMAVPPGKIVRTGYVAVGMVDLSCRERMTPGDVKAAYERLLQLGDRQPWPSPCGTWNGNRFIIEDGRHQFIASLMLGKTHIFVAWLDDNAGEI